MLISILRSTALCLLVAAVVLLVLAVIGLTDTHPVPIVLLLGALAGSVVASGLGVLADLVEARRPSKDDARPSVRTGTTTEPLVAPVDRKEDPS